MEPEEIKPRKKPVHPRASEANVVGPMSGRIRTDGKRALMLNVGEKRDIKRQRLISRIISMFLDVDNPNHDYKEIADACGISKSNLVDITKADDFIQAWNDQYVEIGTDPMIKAARQKVQSLSTKAARTLEEILDDPEASGAARLGAAKLILSLAGITEPLRNKSDKGELQDFLRGVGLNIDTMNLSVTVPSMPLPPGYEKVAEVIDGQLKDVPAPEDPDA